MKENLVTAISIRPYHEADWRMVDEWWGSTGEVHPLPSMMPTDSSFIAEVGGVPALAVTVYLTNSTEVAYVENFIGNPSLSGESRRAAASVLADYISVFAKSLGHKRLVCMTEKESLVKRYKELGFIPTLSGVTALMRET
ncbi:MAG: hypothetical protein V4568_14695 [Pseudomonadota bacterium]